MLLTISPFTQKIPNVTLDQPRPDAKLQAFELRATGRRIASYLP